MVPFPTTTPNLDFKVSDALDVLCAQLTRDLFAITKFLVIVYNTCRLDKGVQLTTEMLPLKGGEGVAEADLGLLNFGILNYLPINI